MWSTVFSMNRALWNPASVRMMQCAALCACGKAESSQDSGDHIYGQISSISGNDVTLLLAEYTEQSSDDTSAEGAESATDGEGKPQDGGGRGGFGGGMPQGGFDRENMPNRGSGKSTLMNIIGCMDRFDIGEYFLNGIPILETKEKELVRIRNQEIGFIFQNYHLIPTYTVMQNIIMPLLMRGMDRKKAERECSDVIEMLGLSDRIHHKPSELSGGQRQRVAIARALCSKPSILLADEPTGALDQKSGTEVLKLFTKLHEIGNTIVMITHDLNVAQWAQRTVRIVDGEVFEE